MKIDVKNLSITDHATQRLKERFQRKNKEDALQYCKCNLGRDDCKYIGVVTGEDGKDAHLFSNGKAIFYISMDLQRIVTVLEAKEREYHPKVNNSHPLRSKLIALYEKEIRRYDRSANSIKSKIHKTQIEYGIELAQLKYRMYKTRSKVVKTECEERIKVIESNIKAIEGQLENINNDKRLIAKAMTSLI